MVVLKSRVVRSNIFGRDVQNTEYYCESVDKWFNEVECFIEIKPNNQGTWLTFPNGFIVKLLT